MKKSLAIGALTLIGWPLFAGVEARILSDYSIFESLRSSATGILFSRSDNLVIFVSN